MRIIGVRIIIRIKYNNRSNDDNNNNKRSFKFYRLLDVDIS